VVVVDVLGNIVALGVPGEHERVVTTLLMSDIVDSTLTATRLGDAAWEQVLAEHNRLIRAQLDRFRGRPSKGRLMAQRSMGCRAFISCPGTHECCAVR